MIPAFFTDMRATLTPIGALEFLVLFLLVWIGLPGLICHVAEQVDPARRRAAGEPEPEGGFQLALPPVTWLPILAALGGWTWWLLRSVYVNRRDLFELLSIFDLGAPRVPDQIRRDLTERSAACSPGSDGLSPVAVVRTSSTDQTPFDSGTPKRRTPRRLSGGGAASRFFAISRHPTTPTAAPGGM